MECKRFCNLIHPSIQVSSNPWNCLVVLKWPIRNPRSAWLVHLQTSLRHNQSQERDLRSMENSIAPSLRNPYASKRWSGSWCVKLHITYGRDKNKLLRTSQLIKSLKIRLEHGFNNQKAFPDITCERATWSVEGRSSIHKSGRWGPPGDVETQHKKEEDSRS